MIVVLHTLAGIIGIIAGVLALKFVDRAASRAPSAAPWRVIRTSALVAGSCLVVATYVWVTALGYEISTPEGSGRIVGLPFFVAFFDARGADYIGWITYVGALGNAVFWFLVPQLGVAAYAWWISRRQIGA